MQFIKNLIMSIKAIILVAFVSATIGVGAYGREKEEPARERSAPTALAVREPALECTPSKTSVSLEDELHSKIVFISSRDGDAGIYVMNADGSEPKHLSDDLVPVWSPDGKKIASQSSRDGNFEIYVMNADGSEQKNLTNNPAHDRHPSWSPDGKKIAFVSSRDYRDIRTRNNEVYVMNADGQDTKRLTHGGIGSFVPSFPSWSPNGKKIAFHSYRDRNHEIYVMNADGCEQKNLTNHPAFDDEPLWSPDGKKIAFVSLRDGNAAQMTPDQRREIYVMNADGSEPKNLTNSPGYDAGLSWSPDGQKIAFCSLRDGNLEIYVMNADGSEQKRLTKDPGEDVLPSWSPDGKKIVFRSKRDKNLEIYVMNADGSEQKNLTDNPAYDGEPSWAPFLSSEHKQRR